MHVPFVDAQIMLEFCGAQPTLDPLFSPKRALGFVPRTAFSFREAEKMCFRETL